MKRKVEFRYNYSVELLNEWESFVSAKSSYSCAENSVTMMVMMVMIYWDYVP
jgi:hypothetical protein